MSHQSNIATSSVTSSSPEPEDKKTKEEEKEYESLEEALTGE